MITERIISESIKSYCVCNECMEEDVDYHEQGKYRMVGFTDVGLEVFCEKHGSPIIRLRLNPEFLNTVHSEKCSCCGESSSNCDNHQTTKHQGFDWRRRNKK